MGFSKSSSKREVYSSTILPQETRKISNKQPNITPKAIREKRTKNPQDWQMERNHKDQIINKWKRNEENEQRSIKLKADSLSR